MKFSVCNEFFKGWKIEDVFKRARDIGYSGVEIAPFTLAESVEKIDKDRRKGIRDMAKGLDMEITGLHWLLASPEGLYINHPDPALRAKTRDYLIELIDFCSDIGGRIMVFGSPKQRNIVEGHTYEEVWEWTREAFKGCLDRAKERDVILCPEALARNDTNFINTAKEARRMVGELNHPNFKMILDVKAMCDEGRPIEEIINENKDLLVHMHVNDANLEGPGFGNTDFRPIFKELKNFDYQGFLSVEVFKFDTDPVIIAKRSYEYMKGIEDENPVHLGGGQG